MPQFKVGDRVCILSNVASSFVGLDGEILEVLPNERGLTTLDQYVVKFSWGEQQKFYDVQLRVIAKMRKKSPAA